MARGELAKHRAAKKRAISLERKALNKRWHDGGHNKDFKRMSLMYEPHESNDEQTTVCDVYEQYVDSKLKDIDPIIYEYVLCKLCGNMYWSRGVCKCNFNTKLRD